MDGHRQPTSNFSITAQWLQKQGFIGFLFLTKQGKCTPLFRVQTYGKARHDWLRRNGQAFLDTSEKKRKEGPRKNRKNVLSIHPKKTNKKDRPGRCQGQRKRGRQKKPGLAYGSVKENEVEGSGNISSNCPHCTTDRQNAQCGRVHQRHRAHFVHLH